MPIDRLLLLTCVVFEGISSACAFPYQRLFIQGFVTLRLQVKRPLADWLERPFLRAFEVLSVGSSFRLSRDGVILRFEYLMNERDCLWSNFSVSPTLVIAGKQSDKATPIRDFSLAMVIDLNVRRKMSVGRSGVEHSGQKNLR